MTIIAITSSPRANGNSDTITDAIISGAKENGKTVKKYDLNKMNIIGCQACMGCKKTGKCIQKDDMVQLLEDVKQADSLILSAPIYFGQPSAQFKMFEDRCYSLIDMSFKPFIEKGKKLVTVITCGSGTEEAEAASNALESVYQRLFGMIPVDRIMMGGGGPKDAAANNKEIMDRAKEAGKRL